MKPKRTATILAPAQKLGRRLTSSHAWRAFIVFAERPVIRSFINVIGGLGLVVLGNGLYALATGDAAFDWRHVIVTVLGGLVALTLLWGLLRLIQRRIMTDIGLTEAHKPIAPRPGLIVLLSLPKHSQDRMVADVAITHHTTGKGYGGRPLQHCWLIGTQKILDMVEPRMKRDYESVRFHQAPLSKDSPENPAAAYKATKMAYDEARLLQGLGQQDIIADIQGGTKLLSVGMALACLDLNLDIESVTGDYFDTPVTPKEVIAVELQRPTNTGEAQVALPTAPGDKPGDKLHPQRNGRRSHRNQKH